MTRKDPLVLHNGMQIPPALIKTVTEWPRQDEITDNWIERLPETVAHFSEKWDITFDPGIPHSNLTLVLLGNSSKLGPVVFKSSPAAYEFRSEAAALKLAGGERVSRLYDLDTDRNAMIVERIVPGRSLEDAHLPDEEATLIAAHLALEMWDKLGDRSDLHPLRTWMRDLYRWQSRPDRIPDDLITHAQVLGNKLLDSSTQTYLLHGDLHHTNILQRESGDWAIIDPKGLVGDPGFEVAAWMYNPAGIQEQPNYASLAARRFDICSEIWCIDRQHLVRWAFVGAVLSAVWSAVDQSPDEWWKSPLKVAETLREML
jgi:streptomycin 6-kinase